MKTDPPHRVEYLPAETRILYRYFLMNICNFWVDCVHICTCDGRKQSSFGGTLKFNNLSSSKQKTSIYIVLFLLWSETSSDTQFWGCSVTSFQTNNKYSTFLSTYIISSLNELSHSHFILTNPGMSTDTDYVVGWTDTNAEDDVVHAHPYCFSFFYCRHRITSQMPPTATFLHLTRENKTWRISPTNETHRLSSSVLCLIISVEENVHKS